MLSGHMTTERHYLVDVNDLWPNVVSDQRTILRLPVGDGKEHLTWRGGPTHTQ